MFLCNFHSEQAWDRWAAKAAKNVSNCKDELLGRTREIEDMTKFNATVDNLKQLPVWNENKPRQDWVLERWLKQCKVLKFCLVSGSQSF